MDEKLQLQKENAEDDQEKAMKVLNIYKDYLNKNTLSEDDKPKIVLINEYNKKQLLV